MPQRKTDSRPNIKRRVERDGYYCCVCGEKYQKQVSNFFASQSPLYKGNNKFLPICRRCLNELFDHYVQVTGSEEAAMRRICMKYDIYYSDSVFKASNKTSTDFPRVAAYIKSANLRQYAGKTYDTTIDEESANVISCKEDVGKAKEEGARITNAMVERWGLGYTAEEYAFLDKHYKMLQGIINTDDAIQDVLARDLCDTKVQEFRCREKQDNKGMANFKELYQKTLATANLKPRQSKGADVVNPDECWGNWVNMVEEYTPAEYYKNKNLFADFDKIKEYYERFIARPMKNLFTGRRDIDPEYDLSKGEVDE